MMQMGPVHQIVLNAMNGFLNVIIALVSKWNMNKGLLTPIEIKSADLHIVQCILL